MCAILFEKSIYSYFIKYFVVVNQEWTLDFSNAFLTSVEIIIFLPKCITVMNLTTKMEGISYYPSYLLITPLFSEAQSLEPSSLMPCLHLPITTTG